MASQSPPNVLFVFTDQMRSTAMACAGNEDVETPNLDRLADEGTRFSRAYANYPLCTPSRACILTGQYPTTNRVVDNDLPLPEDAPSVARAFKQNGYRTGYVGKWHLDGVPREKWTPPGPRRHGFDDFWAVYNCSHDYFDAKYYGDSPDPIEVDGYEPVTQTDLATEFVRADDDRPFCLFLSWGPPHDPYRMVPDEYKERYDPSVISLRPNAEPILPSHPDHPAPAFLDAPPIEEFSGPGDLYDEPVPYDYEHPREGVADYYAAITALDEQVGRLLDALESEGIAEETILVFTSDHGDMLWSHGKNQKGSPYEEAIGIPFLVRWPGQIPANRTTDVLLSTVDMAPSLLGLTGISPLTEMEGTDLSGVMLGEEDEGPESVFLTNVRRGWRGVRTDRYTYARVTGADERFDHLTHGHGWLLFDNESDPYQRNNLILQAEYDEVRIELDTLLDKWLERLDDPFVPLESHVRRLDIVDAWNERERTHAPDSPRLL